MTLSEAFTQIEEALTELKILDLFGKPYVGIEAVFVVEEFFPEAWAENRDAIQAGKIGVDQYLRVSLELIRKYKFYRQCLKLQKKLSDLRLDQIELDLIREGS